MTPADNSIHILLVEDDTDCREGLVSYLTSFGFSVTGVGSCLECYAALPQSRFSVAILDVTLPDQSGFVLAEYLRANSSIKIIMLTAHDKVEDRVRGYTAGAYNYFVKPVEAQELLAAINSLVAGDRQVHPVNNPSGSETWYLYRQNWQLKTGDGTTIQLTSLELQFIEMLLGTSGHVVSRDLLLDSLYERNDEHSGRALDSLVRRLRAKISAAGKTSPIKTAHAVGYCFSAPITCV